MRGWRRISLALLPAMLVGGAVLPASAQQQAMPPGLQGGVDAQSPGNGTASPPLVIDTPPGLASDALPIMTIDQDALFLRSAWGLRVQADVEHKGRDIADENERLANSFSAEEQELTTLRGTLPAEEFRKRADEFDQRVVEVRRQRDTVARDLQTHADAERSAFFRAALPVLAQLMRERGAIVVLDQRAIFVSAQSADVTDVLIARLNSEIGAGPAKPEDTPAAPPEPAPTAPPAAQP